MLELGDAKIELVPVFPGDQAELVEDTVHALTAPLADPHRFVQLVGAGNDTTKTMLSSGLLALLAHPDQLGELRAEVVSED